MILQKRTIEELIEGNFIFDGSNYDGTIFMFYLYCRVFFELRLLNN